jgi:hypothetical protein
MTQTEETKDLEAAEPEYKNLGEPKNSTHWKKTFERHINPPQWT